MLPQKEKPQQNPKALNLYKTLKRCGKCSKDFDTKVPGYKKHPFYGVVCSGCANSVKAKTA
jgi:hypothetical protein